MALGAPNWVNLTETVPTVSQFNTTQGGGPPINIDKTTGDIYTLINNVVVPLGFGIFINVKFFGAQANLLVDDTVAIQAALNFAGSIGGGVVFVPSGIYKVTSYLTIPINTTIQGTGRYSSTLRSAAAGGGGATAGESLRNGSILYSVAPINSSTGVNINIKDIGLENTNALNNGAGYYDTGGTFITLSNVRVQGFKFGLAFDQSELVDLIYCCLEAQLVAGLWIVNGPDLTPGVAPGFTNRFSMKSSHINQGLTQYGIADDGGGVHSYVDNNYNGCLTHIRASAVDALKISGGEFESAAGDNIRFEFTNLAGAANGACAGIYLGNAAAIIPTIGNRCVVAISVGSIVLNDVIFGNTAAVKFAGAANCNAIYSTNAFNGGGGATFDGMATNHFEVGHNGANFKIRTNLDYENNGNKVLGARGAAVANAIHAVAAPTKAEFDALVDLFNIFKSRMEPATGHGLIA
jgi:hypothetical protein